MKSIEGMQPQINDMERRFGIIQSIEPVLDNALKTLNKVIDVHGMGKNWDSWASSSFISLDQKMKFGKKIFLVLMSSFIILKT